MRDDILYSFTVPTIASSSFENAKLSSPVYESLSPNSKTKVMANSKDNRKVIALGMPSLSMENQDLYFLTLSLDWIWHPFE